MTREEAVSDAMLKAFSCSEVGDEMISIIACMGNDTCPYGGISPKEDQMEHCTKCQRTTIMPPIRA